MEVHCFSSDFGKKHPLISDRKYTRTELIHAPVYEPELLLRRFISLTLLIVSKVTWFHCFVFYTDVFVVACILMDITVRNRNIARISDKNKVLTDVRTVLAAKHGDYVYPTVNGGHDCKQSFAVAFKPILFFYYPYSRPNKRCQAIKFGLTLIIKTFFIKYTGKIRFQQPNFV